jgi:DNA-binding NarL/FixJ family response regulator
MSYFCAFLLRYLRKNREHGIKLVILRRKRLRLVHVTFQPGTAEDMDSCFCLLPSGFVCQDRLRARLPDVWCDWLREKQLHLTTLEDGERPANQRLIAFGISVFVTDDFMEELRSGRLPPSPSTHVVERHLAGRSPVLSPEAVRRANSGLGLNALVLHIGWDEKALAPEEVRWVKAKLLEAFAHTIGGYQIKEIMQEVYSEEEMRRGLAAGALLRSDYARFFDHGLRTLPPPPLRPYLIGNSRAEVQDGSTIAPLFFYNPPRFFFRSLEQELLRYALLGRSDSELSTILHISASTVQKRWHTIYERAAVTAPELFPCEASAGSGRQTRGTEKRRHLIAYLRHHPEELRPILMPKTRK